MSDSSKQNTVIVIVAILFIGISIAATLFFSGQMPGISSDSSDSNTGYQNITLTDAGLTCEKEVRERFGKTLVDLTLDNRSSRYSKSDFAYRIYFEVSSSDKQKKITRYYINCYVHAERGKITTFEVHEDVETPKR